MSGSDVSKTTILLSRLRNLGACDPECEGRCDWCPDAIAAQAADEIDRLIHDNARLMQIATDEANAQP